jgi:transcriptional regulator with XRE-family HTH domain
LARSLARSMLKPIYSSHQRFFLDLLRQARLAAGISQIELAKELGWPQSSVSKCESGIRRLDLIELRVFLTALGVDLPTFVAEFEVKIASHAPLTAAKQTLKKRR